MKTYSRYFILVVLFFICACATKKKELVSTPQQKATPVDSLLAAIEREPCFGKCPEFYASIYKSGYVVYNGKKNVDLIGKYAGRLDANQVQEFYNTISLYRMEQKDSLYVNKFLVDYPCFTLWISAQQPTRKIHLCTQEPPDDIAGFADYFERVLKNTTFKKITEK